MFTDGVFNRGEVFAGHMNETKCIDTCKRMKFSMEGDDVFAAVFLKYGEPPKEPTCFCVKTCHTLYCRFQMRFLKTNTAFKACVL